MLQLFKRNLFLNSLLLLPYCLILRIKGVLTPIPVLDDHASFLLSNISHYFEPRTGAIAAIILIFFQAVMINRLCIRNSYDRHLSLFPGVFYILFVSFVPEYNTISAPLIANTFIILSVSELNRLYKVHQPATTIFNIGLFGMLSILFYQSPIVFVPLYFIGLFSLRTQNLIESFQLLIGFIIGMYLILGIMYLNGVDIKTINIFNSLRFKIPNQAHFNLFQTTFYILLFSGLVLFRRKIILKKAVQVAKKINIQYYLILFSLIGLCLGNIEHVVQRMIVLAIPFGILLGLFTANAKNKFWYELLHLVLFLFVLDHNLDLRQLLQI